MKVEFKIFQAHNPCPYTQMLMAAVPNPEGGLVKRKAEVCGEIPSLTDLPPGCPFAARCPKVMDICKKVMPGVENLGPDHWVRCHLYGPGDTTTVTGQNTAAATAP